MGGRRGEKAITLCRPVTVKRTKTADDGSEEVNAATWFVYKPYWFVLAQTDGHGNLDVEGRLATDRPHVVKLYGAYTFPMGTNVGLNFYAGSGTPLTTLVGTFNQIPVMVNGRGDLGRTPMLTQTDLLIAHNVNIGQQRRLGVEFNVQNLFNQKTTRHVFTSLNRTDGNPRRSSGINLSTTDLAKGFNYVALLAQTADGKNPGAPGLPNNAYDPRFKMDDLFNPGLSARLGIKFMF